MFVGFRLVVQFDDAVLGRRELEDEVFDEDDDDGLSGGSCRNCSSNWT